MVLTCVACACVFETSDAQRAHYKLEWHRVNLKRKVAGLSPLPEADYERRRAALLGEGGEQDPKIIDTLNCNVCRKNFSQQSLLDQHLRSKKHIQRQKAWEKAHPEQQKLEEEDAESEAPGVEGATCPPVRQERDGKEEQGGDEGEGDSDNDDSDSRSSGDKDRGGQGQDLSPWSCIFCSYTAASYDAAGGQPKKPSSSNAGGTAAAAGPPPSPPPPPPAAAACTPPPPPPAPATTSTSSPSAPFQFNSPGAQPFQFAAEDSAKSPQPPSSQAQEAEEKPVSVAASSPFQFSVQATPFQFSSGEAQAFQFSGGMAAREEEVRRERLRLQRVQGCLDHMARCHGFFVPDQEYLVDLEGLLEYLGAKVQVGRLCLYCGRDQAGFKSGAACRQHMIARGHCKLRYEEGWDLHEYQEFYDFSASYEEAPQGVVVSEKLRARRQGKKRSTLLDLDRDSADTHSEYSGESEDEDADTDEEALDSEEGEEEEGDDEDEVVSMTKMFSTTGLGELVLLDGRVVGHRTLRRYYRQKFRPDDDRPAPACALLQASATPGGGAITRWGAGASGGGQMVAGATWTARESQKQLKAVRKFHASQSKKRMDLGVHNNKLQKYGMRVSDM